jgi:hypothetical protein
MAGGVFFAIHIMLAEDEAVSLRSIYCKKINF